MEANLINSPVQSWVKLFRFPKWNSRDFTCGCLDPVNSALQARNRSSQLWCNDQPRHPDTLNKYWANGEARKTPGESDDERVLQFTVQFVSELFARFDRHQPFFPTLIFAPGAQSKLINRRAYRPGQRQCAITGTMVLLGAGSACRRVAGWASVQGTQAEAVHAIGAGSASPRFGGARSGAIRTGDPLDSSGSGAPSRPIQPVQAFQDYGWVSGEPPP